MEPDPGISCLRAFGEGLVVHLGSSAGLGIWTLDLASGAFWASPEANRLLGLESAPPDLAAVRGHILEEDQEGFGSFLEAARLREAACEFRLRAGGEAAPMLLATATPAGASALAGTLRVALDGPFVTEALRQVVEGTGVRRGEDFFQALVIHLAAACGTRYAFLAEFTDARRNRVRTFALCCDGRIAPDFEYDLGGTPCARVAGATVCLHPRNVQRLYPEDHLLVEMGIESYLGVPLFDSRGEPFGILIVLHDRPLVRGQDVRTILSIFAARAAAERERMKAEAARADMELRAHHAQRLESLGLLAGGIAHDFNNYLHALLGNLELAGIALESRQSPAKYLDSMQTGILQASELTRQMLAYSGRGTQLSQQLDLSRLVAEMSSLLRASVPKRIAMEQHLWPEPLWVLADPGQMQQIVLNLVTNAADAMRGAPGRIELRTLKVELRQDRLSSLMLAEGREPGTYVLLEVQDTGCGMDRETLERIFEPFFTTKESGRGLGLSAMLGIVKGHFGALDVDSEPGAGTTFRLFFPASDGKAGGGPS